MATSSAPLPDRATQERTPAAIARRLWSQPRSRSVVLYVLVALMLAVASRVPNGDESPLARLERSAFDTEVQVLRDRWPLPIADDVVLIGIDEGSEEAFTEPLALWHRHFARLLGALSEARPRAVGVDIVPPERSYDDIVPGYDLALFRAIRDLRQKTVVAFALTVDREGRAARVHPTFLRVHRGAGTRRRPATAGPGLRRPPVQRSGAGQVATGEARSQGKCCAARGSPSTQATSTTASARAWNTSRCRTSSRGRTRAMTARLEKAFRGRMVLVGYVMKRADRWELPVQLIDIDGQDGGPRAIEPAWRHHPPPGAAQPSRERIAQADARGDRWALCLLAAGLVFFHFRLAVALVVVAAPHGSRRRRRPLCHPRTAVDRARSRRSSSRSGPASLRGPSSTGSRTRSSEGAFAGHSRAR